jgi:hypothetical protein
MKSEMDDGMPVMCHDLLKVETYESKVINVNLPDKNSEVSLTLSPREFGTEIGDEQKRPETLSIQWAWLHRNPALSR